jgi:uncharacterized protein (TIGR03435 family)
MLRSVLAIVVSLVLVSSADAQAPKPQFEVASIKPSPPEPPTPGTAGLRITQRQARFTFLSLKDYIGMGYGVQVYQIIAPEWVASTRFEIIATIPEGQDPKDTTKMMAALLEDRFHLKTHREMREFPVYALETLPGFKLEPLTADAPGDAFTVTSTSGPNGAVVDLGQGALLSVGANKIEFKKVTMQMLAAVLERFVDRPVVDQTGRAERFNVAIELMPDDFTAAMIRSAVAAGVTLPAPAMRLLDTASPNAIPDALKALGLSMKSTKAPLEVVVVDSMEKAPTEN